jgi:tol-pal system protein YbgF
MRRDLASVRQAQETGNRDATDAVADVKALDSRVRELNAAVRETAQQLGQLRARVTDTDEGLARVRTDLAVRVSASAPAPVVAPERPVRETAAVPRQSPAEAAYGVAVATFRAREHGQAVLEFMDFLAKYPRHSLASNAQYWIGEAYYIQHDYRQALTEFQKVLDVDTGNGKAADALLRMGFCYTNLHEPLRAHQAWQRLVREHPASEAAVRARALLRSPRSFVR